MTFEEWIKKHNCEEHAKGSYTLKRIYLYELYLRDIGNTNIKEDIK